MTATSSTAAARPVQITAGDSLLIGDLTLPDKPRGLVVFAHGSGSSRHSSRNRAVARALQHERFGTLLLDLLTEPEERTDVVTAEFRFDIPLLGRRVPPRSTGRSPMSGRPVSPSHCSARIPARRPP